MTTPIPSTTTSDFSMSNEPISNKIEYSEENIINFVSQLYTSPHLVSEANNFLTDFQQHPSAWPICISILNQHANNISQMLDNRMLTVNAWQKSLSDTWTPPSPINEVLFFASQTLCTQAQAGFPQQLDVMKMGGVNAFREIRSGLCNLIYIYRYGPRQALQQLTIALCSCLMFAFKESLYPKESPITQIIYIFDEKFGEQRYELILNIFTILPQEILNHRVALERETREELIKHCLVDVPTVWQMANKIYEEIEISIQTEKLNISLYDIPTVLMRKSLNSFNQWIFVYLMYFLSLNENDSDHINQHSKIVDELFISLNNNPLFTLILKNLTAQNIETAQICSDALLHTLCLSQNTSEDAFKVLRLIISAYIYIFDNLHIFFNSTNNKIDEIDSSHLVVLTHPLVEFAKIHFPNLLYKDIINSENSLYKLSKYITNLLKHQNFNVKQQTLDFWYNLLAHQFKAISNSNYSSHDEESSSHILNQREALKPLFQIFADAMLANICYPSSVEDEEFDFEGFQKFRDDCSINLTESTIILGYNNLLDKAGEEFMYIMNENNKNETNWIRLEVCLFILTTVAERAPAGEDNYIPNILKMLPNLPYHQNGIIGLIMRRTAARLILWTAGYVGKNSEIFGFLFDLVARDFASFIGNFEPSTSNQENERLSCESTITNTLNSLTAAAGIMLVSEGGLQDIHYVLDTLTKLIVTDKMSTENRASLINATGSVLSYLDKSTLQELFSTLISPLSNDALRTISEDSIKLYFAALHCVHVHNISPPPSINDKINENDEYSHPVLNVLQNQWPIIEQIIFDNRINESKIQICINSLVSIFSSCRVHITSYVLFYSFLDVIGRSYIKKATVYHLAAVRTLIGIFSNVPSDQILTALNGPLQICVEFILNKFQDKGEEYGFLQPDLIGMTVDCVNVALLQSVITQKILKETYFISLCQAVIQLTPTCLHPKVLHTYMVFLSKLVAWVQPPPQLFSPTPDYNLSWIQATASEAKQIVTELLDSNFAPNNITYLHGIINAVIKSVTNHHIATQSWIGNAAQTLLPLLNHPYLSSKAKESLKFVILDISPKLMSDEKKDIFYTNCISEIQPRKFADLLMKIVEETQVEYRRSQFKTANQI